VGIFLSKLINMTSITSSQDTDLVHLNDDFISMAAHELKTPLTSLRAYNQIIQSLLEKNCVESALTYTYKMQNQFDRLNKLIFDLLDVSRIQSGQLDLARSIFYLDDVTREVVRGLQPAFASHLIYTKGKTEKKVLGDPERVGQVITNFIINAVKYSPRSDYIVISLESIDEACCLHVQDFGVGIDKKHQDRIFERYYRVNDENDKKYSGLGIGLYVSSEIIKRQGGRTWVESSPGHGSTFSFSLPAYAEYYEPKNYGR
jgi:signal transduction histidine kinase